MMHPSEPIQFQHFMQQLSAQIPANSLPGNHYLARAETQIAYCQMHAPETADAATNESCPAPSLDQTKRGYPQRNKYSHNPENPWMPKGSPRSAGRVCTCKKLIVSNKNIGEIFFEYLRSHDKQVFDKKSWRAS